MVRPGIGLYGMVCPESFHERILLEPALSWCTSIHHIKKYPAGACLGYDRTYVTKRNSVIAVIPVGYADGYPRHLSNRGRVLVCGRYAPVVGRISMDYTMIDVTDIPEALVRAEVMLIGRDGENSVTAEELAARTDTIPYCITTGIAHRPVRKSNLA
jgi:alanine racemase